MLAMVKNESNMRKSKTFSFRKFSMCVWLDIESIFNLCEMNLIATDNWDEYFLNFFTATKS